VGLAPPALAYSRQVSGWTDTLHREHSFPSEC